MKFGKARTAGMLLTLLILIIGALAIFSKKNDRKFILNNDCSASLSMYDKSARFSARLNIYLNLRNDNTGYLDFGGKISNGEENYTIARAWRFDYVERTGDTLHLSRATMEKRAADNSPDALVNARLFSVSSDKGRYVKIRKLHNTLVIGNLYSPLFLCQLHNK
ncbi:hypothetical protein JV483_003531 [Escherichia coli]|nr:hypothetical protein [Escherichia coli]EII9938388.1 hypothetical protein [Escherichia coli]EKE4262208.1 hypothetical protein [Escherichia coli]NJB27240.1 hypothetical protein [Escherichia coli]HDX3227704.1 hypothetical protein [Escherichia coli]